MDSATFVPLSIALQSSGSQPGCRELMRFLIYY